MSETSSSQSRRSASENNNGNKKKVSYSTDYLPQLLQDSQKMVPLDQRINYQRNEKISEEKSKMDNYTNPNWLCNINGRWIYYSSYFNLFSR